MIVSVPIYDSKRHDLTSSTCECCPTVAFEDGEMIINHNQLDASIDTKWLITDDPDNLQYNTRVLS